MHFRLFTTWGRAEIGQAGHALLNREFNLSDFFSEKVSRADSGQDPGIWQFPYN